MRTERLVPVTGTAPGLWLARGPQKLAHNTVLCPSHGHQEEMSARLSPGQANAQKCCVPRMVQMTW